MEGGDAFGARRREETDAEHAGTGGGGIEIALKRGNNDDTRAAVAKGNGYHTARRAAGFKGGGGELGWKGDGGGREVQGDVGRERGRAGRGGGGGRGGRGGVRGGGGGGFVQGAVVGREVGLEERGRRLRRKEMLLEAERRREQEGEDACDTTASASRCL